MSAGALSTAEFETLMRPLGPFEPRPHLAVGVSGGADSMALAHLAAAWVASRGGQIAALVVDHGLRAESRAESEAACAI
jgi:tRNA(Ile)-lysidine synthase